MEAFLAKEAKLPLIGIFGSIESELVDRGVIDILQDRAGYPAVENKEGKKNIHEDIQELHKKGEEITVEELGLERDNKIEELILELSRLCREIYKKALERGVIPTLTDTLTPNISLVELWENAVL